MRVLLPMILCLFMAVCVLANDGDFLLGEKKENDRLVYKKIYIKVSDRFSTTISYICALVCVHHIVIYARFTLPGLDTSVQTYDIR